MSITHHTAPSFNLADVVADVCAANPTVADPADLTILVLGQIDTDDYYDALHQTLRLFVTSHITQHRPTNHQSNSGSGGSTSQSGTGTGRTVGRSRLAGIGDLLTSREFSPHRGGWILLSDATVDDLRSIAAKRGETAATYIAKQQWFDGVADLLVTHKVVTVSDLPVTIKSALAAGTLP